MELRIVPWRHTFYFCDIVNICDVIWNLFGSLTDLWLKKTLMNTFFVMDHFFLVKIFIKCNWYFKIFPMNISTFLLYYNYFKKLNLCFLSYFFWCLIHKRFLIDHYKFLDTQNLVWKVFIVSFFNECPKLNNVDLWHPVLNKKNRSIWINR